MSTFRPLPHLILALAPLIFGACSPTYNPELPNALELGTPRGLRVARVIMHFHSPYSYDACDSAGIVDGVVNAECANEVRAAMCVNRVDGLFMSDHPANMENYSFQDLSLAGPYDTLITGGSGPVGMTVGTCGNGFRPSLYIGYESAAGMALGMSQHVGVDPATRDTNYTSEAVGDIANVKSTSGALMAVPHTEDRSADWIAARAFDAIEIYNYHTNVDPKIRKRAMGVPPFSPVPSILSYLLDPYHDLNPDYAFIQFLEVYPSHFEKWNTLLVDKSFPVAGIGSSDSHQNVFKHRAGDGERLDAHRRVARFMSNHYLVTDTAEATLKAAVKAMRGWVVFEGFGSPVGMDFYATQGGTTAGVGETLTLGGGSARITVPLPSLHAASPQAGDPPSITIRLKHILTGGKDETVAVATDTALNYDTNTAGVYRAELTIVPHHLKKFLGEFDSAADESHPWIYTNPLWLN